MMKTACCLIAALGAFAQSGCLAPLSLERDTHVLTKAIGNTSGDIQFASYCAYGEGRPWDDTFTFNEGTLVLTSSALHLFYGNIDAVMDKKEIKIPISEMKGVNIESFVLNRQIHVLTTDHLYVLSITKSRQGIDRQGSQQLFEMIRAHGVPKWDNDEFYKERPPMMFIPIIGK
jgi:hypothetical protein